MSISYETHRRLSVDAFRDLLVRSTLGARRPIDDDSVLEAMLEHADILCTAWKDTNLIGVAHSVTDFQYCCYLSDLAVDEAYQGLGVGKELIRQTQSLLGDGANLILLAAPKAVDYYPKLGFEKHQSAWVIPARKKVE